MHDSFSFTVPPISDEKISGLNTVPIKAFCYAHIGNYASVTDQGVQLETVMNSPIRSSTPVFTDRCAVDESNPKLLGDITPVRRYLKLAQQFKAHPAKPFCRHLKPMQQGNVRNLAKANFFSISSCGSKGLSISQMDQQHPKQNFSRGEFSSPHQSPQLSSLGGPMSGQEPQHYFPVFVNGCSFHEKIIFKKYWKVNIFILALMGLCPPNIADFIYSGIMRRPAR
jgi:hypothetical protein